MHIEVVSGLKLNFFDCDLKQNSNIWFCYIAIFVLLLRFHFRCVLNCIFKNYMHCLMLPKEVFSVLYNVYILYDFFQYSRHKIRPRQSGRRKIFFWRHGEGKNGFTRLTCLIFLLQFAQSKNGAKEIGRKSKHTSWYCEGTTLLVSLCCSLAIYTLPWMLE